MAAFSSSALAAVPLLILAFAASLGVASDADPLQDFCVADPAQANVILDCKNPAQGQDFCAVDPAQAKAITINGFVCKNPAQVSASDFTSGVLSKPGDTDNDLGSNVTVASVLTFAGLNTQGLSIARLDFAPDGLNPPHVHPRATEVLFLVDGTLKVGFVTATPNNTLFEKTLYAGDLFVFPRGLVHFQLNVDDKKPAFAISGLNSQNGGLSVLTQALFAADLPLPDQVLEKAFAISKGEVQRLEFSVAKTLH